MGDWHPKHTLRLQSTRTQCSSFRACLGIPKPWFQKHFSTKRDNLLHIFISQSVKALLKPWFGFYPNTPLSFWKLTIIRKKVHKSLQPGLLIVGPKILIYFVSNILFILLSNNFMITNIEKFLWKNNFNAQNW